MDDLLQKHARLIAGLEAVGQVSLETMNLLEAVPFVAEKILWLGDFRSLMFALVDWESCAIRVVADFSHSNLVEGRKTPASFLRRYSEHLDRVMHLDAEPDNPACRCAVTREVICIVDGEDEALKECGEAALHEWRGKAAYFIPLTHEHHAEAVVATGSPIEDHEHMMAWTAFLRPFFDVCGTQLRNARSLDGLKSLSANLPQQVAANLTEREKEVLCLIARGLKDAEIAGKLHISVNTVAAHRKNIAQKTGKKTKLKMALYAYMGGLVMYEEPNEP